MFYVFWALPVQSLNKGGKLEIFPSPRAYTGMEGSEFPSLKAYVEDSSEFFQIL